MAEDHHLPWARPRAIARAALCEIGGAALREIAGAALGVTTGDVRGAQRSRGLSRAAVPSPEASHRAPPAGTQMTIT